MCKGLAAPHLGVQKAALEALHALYSRHSFTEEEFTALVLPMYDAEFVNLCGRLFEWSTVDAQEIDDDKYQFAKKFSEMISCLGGYLGRRYTSIPSTADIQPFLQLLLLVVQSQSLVVSIPVLVTWTRLLSHQSVGPLVANTPLVGPLLDVCSSRLIRYESLPEDTEDPTFVLLLEDTDTIPERHAFLGNYRRYSSQVIESIVQLKLSDAFVHILGQAENVIRTLYNGQPTLDGMDHCLQLGTLTDYLLSCELFKKLDASSSS
jgi:exportin-5